MSYNKTRANKVADVQLSTAGKITIFTAVSGLSIFLLVFLLNLGHSEFNTAQAQSQQATTSVTVLNTPPLFDVPGEEPREQTASASSSPTNSGDDVVFIGTATDQNEAPYFLLICESNAAQANQAAGPGSLGTAPPTCVNGDQIAVSTSTVSGQEAFAATTTTEAMNESYSWWAFACDDDPVSPECSPGTQGSSTIHGDAFVSPFVVNFRPKFTGFSDDGPVDPGGTLTFFATSSDSNTEGGNDTMKVHVCVANDYDPNANACGSQGWIASSTFTAGDPVVLSAATTTKSPYQDGTYDAYMFVVDEHGHEADPGAPGGQQGANNQFEINNVAPTIDASLISLNGGDDMILDTAEGTTTDFTLSFVAADDNSCENASSNPEITNYVASVFRSGVGSTSCSSAGQYDPNSCYPSDVASTTWNGTWQLSCNATTTGPNACGGSTDTDVLWECNFPLWYVADPTATGSIASPFEAEDWRAAVSAVDDNNATSTFEESITAGIEVEQFLAFALDDTAIPFGQLEPGDNTVTNGSTSIPTDVRPTGNVGLDIELEGLQMCPNDLFAVGACPNANATNSIAVSQIKFNLTPFSDYVSDGTALDVPGNEQELEINAPKATTTAPLSQPVRAAYWALEIPGAVTFAGAYTGRNTFFGAVTETLEWTE